MGNMYFLGIDQGTTGTTAMVFDESWTAVAKGYCQIPQYYPQPGWVEHDALEVWRSIRTASEEALRLSGIAPAQLRCIGVDHEGESVVAWDKETGEPIHPVIVWQDRRTTQANEQLHLEHGALIREKTGLTPDPYFSAAKIRWLLDHVPAARQLEKAGRLIISNLDAFIAWHMTGGRAFCTDPSTASRTMLFDIHRMAWDDTLLSLLGIPRRILPEIRDNASLLGNTCPSTFLGLQVPLASMLVDQQAALFGQHCLEAGQLKTTYGTGCFTLMNTGASPVYSPNGLLPTIAWRIKGQTTYALDGGVYIAGAAIQWLRDQLGIIQSAAQTEQLARTVEDNGGVYFVPAFTGLAAPHWDSYARGMLIGISGGTNRAHIVRATFEAIAYQVHDIIGIMQQDSQMPIRSMRCDGGAAVNSFLMQFQADILGIPVEVPVFLESTVLGAARMGALGAGLIDSTCMRRDSAVRIYTPTFSQDQREALLHNWQRALARAKHWLQP